MVGLQQAPLLANQPLRVHVGRRSRRGRSCRSPTRLPSATRSILLLRALSEIVPEYEPRRGHYNVLGYPSAKNIPNHVTCSIQPIVFTYGTYLRDSRDVDRFAPGVSIAVSWTNATIMRPDGTAERMPDVFGISGGGMWLLHADHANPGRLPQWRPDGIRLAAIEHHVVKGKYIKGTLIRRAIDLIANDHPDLRASIELSLPPT